MTQNNNFGSETNFINDSRLEAKLDTPNAAVSDPISEKLESYRKKFQEYRSAVQRLTASLDATKAELKNAEDQIDQLRNEYKLLNPENSWRADGCSASDRTDVGFG